MKRLGLLLFACMASALAAQDRAAAIVYNSNVITNNAWKRDVVMRREPSGQIFNDQRQVGSAADLAAATATAEEAAAIADEANAAMTNEVRRLDDAAASASTNALALALVVRPETTRTNLTYYVVKTETDGVTDTQWVWCNWNLVIAPNRFVVYQTYGQCATNKFYWTDWNAPTNITVNGRTWNGCRKGTVTRPTWAQGGSCLDLPNDTLGGETGFDFGDLTLTIGGRTPFTGFVTNNISGEVLYFDQGINKGTPPEEP